MAALTGKGGEIKYAAKTIYRLNHWEVNAETNILDVTSWTTVAAAWRSNIAGLQQWSGSVSGFWDMIADTSGQKLMQTRTLTPTTGTIILYADLTGGENYRGDILFQRANVAADIDGTVNVSFDFTGNGPLNYSTAT